MTYSHGPHAHCPCVTDASSASGVVRTAWADRRSPTYALAFSEYEPTGIPSNTSTRTSTVRGSSSSSDAQLASISSTARLQSSTATSALPSLWYTGRSQLPSGKQCG